MLCREEGDWARENGRELHPHVGKKGGEAQQEMCRQYSVNFFPLFFLTILGPRAGPSHKNMQPLLSVLNPFHPTGPF